MSIAPLPTPLQDLGGRRFSFYPPIRNLEPNEWLYRRVTWSECVVVNAKSGEEACIPRVFLGEVSRIDDPVMIVGLNRELECRSGAIIPRRRAVIELPVAVNDGRTPTRSQRLAPVINIRLEPKPETRAWKWVGVAAVLGAVAFTIVADVARQTQSHQRPDLFRGYRSYLQLAPGDDYAAVIGKLGIPASAGSREIGDRVFRLLSYPGRRYSVILMGTKQNAARYPDGLRYPDDLRYPEGLRYIGTLDARGRVLDAVRFHDGSSAESLLDSPGLRSLLRF